jgi:hypothetical protein
MLKVINGLIATSLFIFNLAIYSETQAATINATSCSRTDVGTAVSSASDGDTVIIPNGACTWTSGISTTKQITIAAQNSGLVTLTHNAGGSPLLTLTTGNSFSVHVSGIRFMRGSGSGEYLNVGGSGSKVGLVDGAYFDVPDNFGVLRMIQWTARGGVIWNTTFESTTVNGTGGSNGAGSGSFHITSPKAWRDASTWGMEDANGDQNLYIEDSTFINIYNQAVDCDDNCRLTVRHSIMRNTQMLTHGTTSLQGGRQTEFHDNQFQYRTHAANGSGITTINLNRYFWSRAGTHRFTDNSFENITSMDWGNKTELVIMDESLTRSGAGAPCQSTYPGTHWSGQGANGTSQVTDPVRIWNNTGTWTWGTNDQADGCGNGLSTANFFLLNRDIFLSAPANYTKFTYPHPLRTGISGDTMPPSAPTSLRVN